MPGPTRKSDGKRAAAVGRADALLTADHHNAGAPNVGTPDDRDAPTLAQVNSHLTSGQPAPSGPELTVREPDKEPDQAAPDFSEQLLLFDAVAWRRRARTLIDSGASGDFVTAAFVRQNGLKTKPATASWVRLPNGAMCQSNRILPQTHIRLPDGTTTSASLRVVSGLEAAFDVLLGKPWLTRNNPSIDWRKNFVKCPGKHGFTASASLTRESILTLLSVQQVRRMVRGRNGAAFGTLRIRQLDSDDGGHTESGAPKKDNPALASILNEFADVFEENEEPRFPPKREVDHVIEVTPGARPHFQQPFRLSLAERAELKRQLEGLLAAGLVRPSKSPWGAPVLFVKKKDGGLRLCIDWRKLNAVTKKNRTMIPRIDDLLDELGPRAQWFTKIDLRSAYHQVRIAPEDIEKTAFRTPFGHFEFTVLSFGLCNAPATFQTLMFAVLRPYLGTFVCCYLDDVLIYSETLEEHQRHVRLVLKALREHKLFAHRGKSEWGRRQTTYLGHVVGSGGTLCPDPSIVASVRDWPSPKTRRQVQAFLGLANWHRRFIKNFSALAQPLTELTRKNVPFEWGEEEEKAFQTLKEALTTAPVLRTFDPSLPTRLVTDASKFAIGCVLQQCNDAEEKTYHPVSFYSRKLSPAERNYPVHEQELLALISALRHHRHYLHGTRLKVQLHTDHRSLTYLPSQPHLSGRQARWMETLAEFDTEITYVQGTSNVVADALSRRDDLQLASLSANSTPSLPKIRTAQVDDPFACAIQKAMAEDPPPSRTDGYEMRDGVLVYHGRLYVPEAIRQELLYELHEGAGHFGVEKTLAKAMRQFFWRGMEKDIRKWAKSCASCLRQKVNRGRQPGLHQALPPPKRPWADISRDFITGLPKTSNGFDAIAVDVCRLTKCAVFTPSKATDTAREAARRFFASVVRRFGLPESIVSDRDPKFTSKFWRALMTLTGTRLRLSTADHPRTDGQTEVTNRTLEEMLRHVVREDQGNWDECLPLCEFAYNNSVSTTTKMTPFEALYGFAPHTPLSLCVKRTCPRVPAATDFASDMRNRHQLVRDRILQAQARQEAFANRKRREVTFAVGDKVLLSAKALSLASDRTGTPKLRDRYVGPFAVVRRVGPVAYQLRLPPHVRTHPVFHVSKLRAFNGAREPSNNTNKRDPAYLLDDSPQRGMEGIIDERRTRSGRLQYLVKWVNEDAENNTWEPAYKLRPFPELLQEFRRRQRPAAAESRPPDVLTAASKPEGAKSRRARSLPRSRRGMQTTCRQVPVQSALPSANEPRKHGLEVKDHEEYSRQD